STTVCVTNPAFAEEVSVSLDASGNAYVLGLLALMNSANTFALLHPIQSYTYDGGNALTVIKLDPTGAEQWGTLLGSSLFDGGAGSGGVRNQAYFIKTDGTGAVYVLGLDRAFATTPGSLQPVDVNAVEHAFLAKIVPSLNAAVPVVAPAAVVFPNSQVIGTSSAPFDVIVGDFGDADMGTPSISITGSDFSQTNTCSR